MRNSRVDVPALYAALDRKRRGSDASWRDVARELGVSASTLSRMAHGHRPDLDTFATLVGWLGLPADRFIRTSEGAMERSPDVVSMISSVLRTDSELDVRDAEALEEIIAAAYGRFRARRSSSNSVRRE